MDLCVRPLTEEDLDRVCELEEKNFSMPWKKEDFRHLIEDAGSEYFVLQKDLEVIGCAGYTDMGGDGYINNVVIDEKERGQGLGTKLLRAVMEEGTKKGILNYTLEVRVSNLPAVRLYEGLGFISAGVRKRFYEQPVEDAYVMWLRQEK